MKTNYLKNILLSATIIGSISLSSGKAFADPVTTYSELKTAINNATAPTSIDIQGKLTDDTPNKDAHLKLHNKSITINGVDYVDATTGQTLQSSIVSNGKNHLGFDVQSSSELTLNNLTISNFKNDGWGGTIYNEGKLAINNVSLVNNVCSHPYGDVGGGAISNHVNGYAKITGNSSFIGNSTTNTTGGAIFNSAQMEISTDASEKMTFQRNSASKEGGAIYNDGVLSLYGNYEFLDNSANTGGAIYNDGTMSIQGSYKFSGNTATSNGGAITNEKGNLSIIGTRSTSSNTPITSASDASISFEGNSVSNGSDKMGGAIYVTGTDDKQAFLTINNADFKYNSAGTHGGAIYLDKSVDFNIENSKFIGNRVLGNSNPNHGWGGAIGLGSQGGAVNGYINNTLFDSNYSSNSGGAIPSGTALTIVNSVFTNNQAKFSAGAVSYDPRGSVDGKFLKIIADGGDTVFSDNWVGDTKKISTAEGLYIGNAIVGDDGESITGDDGNDSNVYFNAGNSGRIIFNDIVNAKGDSPDNIREKSSHVRADKNNPNIQLNQGDISYSKYDPNVSTGNINYAPSNGTIIFNNTVQGANLVLHNGTLAFGQNDAYAAQPMTERPEHYFSDGAKITLKGGTLDLINNSIEEGSIFNPVSINVINDANLRLDVSLSGNGSDLLGTIDYIDSVISGDGTLTIDRISFSEDENAKNADVGKSTTLRFAKTNSANTVLSDNLKTIITSNAGYTLNGKISGDDSETTDSIEVTKTINAGGLPVAVSLGSNDRTYIYNATADEEITGYEPVASNPNDNAWGKKFSVWDGTTTHNYTASNILQGEKLTINGNGKNIIASKNAHVIGIEVGSVSANQVLTINDVKKADNTGWGYFNSAIINKGGTVNINNSIFSDNEASEKTFSRDAGATSETKLGNGGALYNEKGTLNITNTDFLNNSAEANGGAIYNAVSGIVNINATDENTVTFNGNTATNGNDIYNDGTLNLTALEKSSIVFNGGISGGLTTDGNNLGIINIGNDVSRGDIIFNNTVANQNINLNYGTLQLGANATDGKDNYFNNVNLALNGGTLNAQNGLLDTIKVKDLTIGDLNPELKLDVDLKGTSDKIEVSGNVTSNGKLWIGSLNIKGTFADGKDYSIINFIDKDIQSDIAAENKYITINGVSYSVSVNSGTITIMKEGDSSGFAYWVINPNVDARTFTIGSADEIVNAWLEGGNNKLAGTILRIDGGTDGKSLIGQGIKGVELGEYNGNTQQLTIDGVTSYEGFDSAIINNGGNLTILSTKFAKNHAKQSSIDDGNGGVIQNNSGTVTINDGTVFSNNQADGKGGAIYNSQSGIINMTTNSGKTITFENNTADSGNDIYNEGRINISGAGKVLIGGGIAGTKTSSITNTASNIELGGSNSDYLGTYTQNKSGDANPTLTVKQGATFFGGTSNINAGTLNWNTKNDIADNAKLTINNASLVVGENGLLTIKGESSIDNASSVTSNGNLVLAKNMTVKTIDGSGTLTANNSTLTFDNNSSLGNNLKFASNNATTNIENITSADSIISKIASGENNELTINVDNSNTNSNIKVDGTKISGLNFKNTVNYGGEITGNGTVTNSGDLTVTGDQSGFSGTFTQNSGFTTVDSSDLLFGGTKNINGGTLTISSGTTNYTDVNLGSGATLNQNLTTATSENRANLTSTSNTIKFTGNGASANFSGGNINLSKIDDGNTNTISFDHSNVKLVDSDYTGSTIYNFKNSEIDLIKADDEKLGNYVFDNIETDNTKLSFNIRIKRNDNGNTIFTDTITVNGNEDKVFKLGNIHISGEENGQRGDYNSTNNTLNGAATFDKTNTITGATTSWIYDITNDDQSVKLSINDYANSSTLNEMNKLKGKRFFQFTEKTDGDTYHIADSLENMGKGEFNVSGGDERRDKYTLTGDGSKSFFNITGSEETNLNIKDLTISSAYKDGNGSVISNDNEKAVINIEKTIITGNTSTGNGGAIYNGVNKSDNNTNLIISDTIFDGNSADGKGGAIYNAGNMTLKDTEFKTASDTIYLADNSITSLFGTNTINSNISSDTTDNPDDASIFNFGTLYLNGDNSGYTGDFSQEGENAASAKTYVTGTFFNGHTDIDNGELNWMTDKSESGILNITGGKLHIISSDTVNVKLTLAGIDSENEEDKEYSVIEEAAQVIIDQNSELELKDLSKTTLDNNDAWGGKITLNGGELNLNNITNYNGAKLEANTGDLNINAGHLVVANGSFIKGDVKTTIEDGANLQINSGGNVSLGSETTWKENGTVILDGGNLTTNLPTSVSNGIIQAVKGNLDIASGSLTVGANSRIESAVKTLIGTTATLDIIAGGYVHLGTDDTLGGQVTLNGGTLDYSMITREGEENVIIANTGKLNLLENSVLSIKDPSVIKKAVDVDIRKGATVNLKSSPNAENGSKLELDANDKWNGLIASWTNATLETDGVDNSKSGGQLQQNRGNSIFTNKSNILIDGKNSYIVGGNTSILSGSALHLGSGVEHFVLDNLNMGGNSLLDTMNNTVNKYGIIDNLNVDGVNNVSIDVSPRDWKGDTFVINNLNGQNNGTLNISDFNFIGLAPVDRHIKIQVFDAQNINDVNFTASDKKIFTPIGNYQMFSQGGGAYTASLVDYNPQVYRGQVATLAAYNHQLLVDDMLTNHFILPNERLIDKAAQANKTSSVSPLFAPYQSTIDDGGIWTKTYVSFETLSMTNNLKVGNNVYGTLVGADFPSVKLKKGWKFIPTAYIGYNGGMQGFNNVDMYQNGGQGGFMGTFIKNNFIGSITAYGGGYFNEMSVAGNTDHTGNWFAGTAAKAAYNIHATKHFIIQPTAFVSYNIFGKQNWGTDYGSMSMNSGTLNGINVAPGMNLIYSRDTWSVYGTIQYMFNINDQVGGKAGNVNLPKTEMRHGYINYGIGATKTWKDRLTSYFQINFRNGGRTGIGFQLGLNYLFDWGKPKKKTSQTTPTKPEKHVLKSAK